MVIVAARVTMHIPESQSLKDKRQVMRSLIAQVQRQYHLSAAEVEAQDRHQLGVIGLACVANEAAHANAVIAGAVNFLSASKHDALLLDYQTEVIHAF